MKWPADRIVQSSEKSFGMYEEALPLMTQGVDVIHLEVGMPSFDTPAHIKEACKAALDSGMVHYGDFLGNEPFRRALAEKLAARNGIEAARNEILVTSGLTHGAYITCMAALDPGDEVMLLSPYYPQHINKIELAGGVVVTAPLDRTRDFALDGAAIRERLSPRTRMIILVNPANPTGRVYTREELQELADIAIEHDLLVMSDEVYEQIVFDGARHISVASLPGMWERTITHFAFTKAYAMDGWRMGYAAAPKRFIAAMLKISKNDIAHVNVFVQEGGRAAVSGSQEAVEEMVREDCRRRDLVVERMNAMPGVRCPAPEGSIYAFPDISGTGWDDADLARALLKETSVCVEEGSFYGQAGAGHLRVCFGAEPYERLAEAMDRMHAFFAARGK
ncbi:MAG: pyridoxal phosphate-dependent aminotransferase [Gammaproteobacteria bacterium]|nr:pyridoxal phosphate-dependent aminotransferase [Gammaproteobacteria bacterium]MXW46905.1 pyridoxal phosphate-dependent aminotransferase [Gammaproteobacteria bacterium]MYD02163.1 pyridoxal phosphate-dependent aminotransferase [Gammaproteobacteria bacterium]MYI24372.1 pyridoxal phosphate-dependent aminotransferase [Gammaproteobacteria bacterium]